MLSCWLSLHYKLDNLHICSANVAVVKVSLILPGLCRRVDPRWTRQEQSIGGDTELWRFDWWGQRWGNSNRLRCLIGSAFWVFLKSWISNYHELPSFPTSLQSRFGICYRHLTCQSIPQAWDAATKARQNWTYPGRCRFICMVILDAFVWSFAWFESFASIFPTYIMSVELSTYISLLYACIICIHLYSFISFIWWFVWSGGSAWWWQCHIAAGAFCQRLGPKFDANFCRKQGSSFLTFRSIRSLNDLRRPEACLMRRPGCKLQCL